MFQSGRCRCIKKLADGAVADGWRRLLIWKEMAYLIQGLAGDIVADKDSVDRRENHICSNSDGVLV